MEIFNPGWNFNSLNRVEISSQLNSKLPFKMTLQLHVKISTGYTELKFQAGMQSPNFPYNWHFFQPGMKIWYYAHVNSLLVFFLKIKMTTSQTHFKWTDDKLINPIKCLQEFDSLYVKLSSLNIDSFQWL